MHSLIEHAAERPGSRATSVRPDQTATPPALEAGHRPPVVPRARLLRSSATALARLIGEAVANWRERQRRRAAIDELRALDDRTLKDIGLTRGEIMAAVDGRLDRGGAFR